MNRRETERILHAIYAVRRAGARAALATVVRVRGSAYRREGTRILVREDGSYECLLSGGCLEPAVADAALRVIDTGEPVLRAYDLADDSLWGLSIGCSGAVDVLIQRLEDDAVTRAWLDALERAEPAVLVTPLGGAAGLLLVRPHDQTGTLGDPALDREAAERARRRLQTGRPESATERLGDAELFFDAAGAPPELTVFGAGFDAVPLVRLAWDLGFDVTVVDAREAFLVPDRFPKATLVAAPFSRFPDAVRLTERTAALIMNHHLERDREALRFTLESPAPYIGVLGPRSRFARLLTALEAEGFAPSPGRLSRVRSPVGLAIGAETPEEIAVSIMGEILALQREFDGGFLAGREASIHRPATTAPARV